MDSRLSGDLQRTTARREADIFIYKMMSPDDGNQELAKRVAMLVKSIGKDSFQHGDRVWLIRESSIEGLLTVQSTVYDKVNDKWVFATDMNAKSSEAMIYNNLYVHDNKNEIITRFEVGFRRYMLSVNHGWIVNNWEHGSAEFNEFANQHGGKKQNITAQTGGEHVANLLLILQGDGYVIKNRIGPYEGQQTEVSGYSRYSSASDRLLLAINSKVASTEVAQPMILSQPTNNRNVYSLPNNLALALICPLTKIKLAKEMPTDNTQIQLMRDPVVEITTGITYEYAALEAQYKQENKLFQENVSYYHNRILKNIIGYLSATNASDEMYFSCLDKINNNELYDPISLDSMTQSVITPSGFSYEKNVIENYIRLQEPRFFNGLRDPKNPNIVITLSTLVDNKNLNALIEAWPAFYNAQKISMTL